MQSRPVGIQFPSPPLYTHHDAIAEHVARVSALEQTVGQSKPRSGSGTRFLGSLGEALGAQLKQTGASAHFRIPSLKRSPTPIPSSIEPPMANFSTVDAGGDARTPEVDAPREKAWSVEPSELTVFKPNPIREIVDNMFKLPRNHEKTLIPLSVGSSRRRLVAPSTQV